MIPQLAEDHHRARLLAQGLAGIPSMHLDFTGIRTNIVMANVDSRAMSAGLLVEQLERRNIRARIYADQRLRFVTHRHITDTDVLRAAMETGEIMMQHSRAS
jgi:threonine aldolase